MKWELALQRFTGITANLMVLDSLYLYTIWFLKQISSPPTNGKTHHPLILNIPIVVNHDLLGISHIRKAELKLYGKVITYIPPERTKEYLK